MTPYLTRQVDLPDAVGGVSRGDGDVVVTLRRDGTLTLADHGRVGPGELTALVRERLAVRAAAVTVNADEGAGLRGGIGGAGRVPCRRRGGSRPHDGDGYEVGRTCFS